jgi:hypothetical protein
MTATKAYKVTKAAAIIGMCCTLAGAAVAQSTESACIELQAAEARLQRQSLELLADYPGTAATLLMCAGIAAQQAEPDQMAAFMTCAGFVCVWIGVDECFTAAGRAIEIATMTSWVENRKAELPDCRE